MAREISLGTTSVSPFPTTVRTTRRATNPRYGLSRANRLAPGGVLCAPVRLGLIKVRSAEQGQLFCGDTNRLNQIPDRCQGWVPHRANDIADLQVGGIRAKLNGNRGGNLRVPRWGPLHLQRFSSAL